MATNDKYKDLVHQAEKAVAAVKDPSLKQIAFQKVLDDLLSASQEHEAPAPASSKRRPKPEPAKLRGKARGGPTQYVQELIGDGFFDKPKIISQVKAELGNRGHHIPIATVGVVLLRLCKARVLRRSKLKGAEKNTYAYTIW
jgi:hypothetical protein